MMQGPAVQSAHETMKQAHQEFRHAIQAAMLKADPAIQPILDKLPKSEKGGSNLLESKRRELQKLRATKLDACTWPLSV